MTRHRSPQIVDCAGPVAAALLLFVWAPLQACQHAPSAKPRSRTAEPAPQTAMCTLFQRGGESPLRSIPCRGSDSDFDGIDDAVDLCPTLQEIENGIADQDGCPDPDPDEDGYADFEDACPTLSGVAPDGCPLLDQDRDDIADHLDACPTQAEDLDGEEDSDGCPEGTFRQLYARALQDQIWLAERLEVRPGSVKLSARGNAEFKSLREKLAAHADIVQKIRVVAYASVLETAQGRAKRLAQSRLRRVRSMLRRMGFPKEMFSQSVYPLKRGGERVGRVEVTVWVPLELSLDTLRPAAERPEAEAWARAPASVRNGTRQAPRPESNLQHASPPAGAGAVRPLTREPPAPATALAERQRPTHATTVRGPSKDESSASRAPRPIAAAVSPSGRKTNAGASTPHTSQPSPRTSATTHSPRPAPAPSVRETAQQGSASDVTPTNRRPIAGASSETTLPTPRGDASPSPSSDAPAPRQPVAGAGDAPAKNTVSSAQPAQGRLKPPAAGGEPDVAAGDSAPQVEAPRRATLLFEDDELPERDPRESPKLSAPAPSAKQRIDLSALDDNDEDILVFDDEPSGEDLDLPEGDSADVDILFFQEPGKPQEADWQVSTSP